MTVRRTLVFAVLAVALMAGGCASTSSVDDVNSRLDSIDQKLATLQQSVNEADARSKAAEATAQQAARQADAAAKSAMDSASKSEAIFDKSVRK